MQESCLHWIVSETITRDIFLYFLYRPQNKGGDVIF